MNLIDKKAIENIRVLTMEMITKAKSGHPGIALGAAPIMHALYSKVLKQSSLDSKWINRDRFVLAAGHGSSLLYAVLHLAGYNVSIDDLKNFRQINSNTAGHPELNHLDGVDATSGPLGQGIPMAVGMAISESFLRTRYNKEENESSTFSLFDNYTYVLCGDGDLQEGVTNEALSLAGHLKLNKLIIIYDSNDIQLDGKVENANTENVKMKLESMNFNYLRVENSEDEIDDLLEKITEAKSQDKPTLIEVKTIIGKTSSKENTSDVHGSPLSDLEVVSMREKIGGTPFEVSPLTYEAYQELKEENDKKYLEYQDMMKRYQKQYPAEYMELMMFLNNEDKLQISDLQMPYDENYNSPTRNTIGEIITNCSRICPILIGGSADLTKSTYVKGTDGDYSEVNRTGRNINYGVREHAMGSISNGINLYGIMRSFCGGFFVFADYLKPAIRMSALMKLPVIYCFTHDSIAVGEDGPTHQPIEQLTMIRSIPNVNCIRPAGKEETKEAFLIAYNSKTNPTVIVLSRQKMVENRNVENSFENLTEKGGYIISREPGVLQGIILATGSEVELAVNVQKELTKDGISVRVVSMPSMFLFDKQDEQYKEEILPKDKYILGLEMGEATHMYKYIKNGRLYNINEFGLSGKASDVLNHFGYNVKEICEVIKKDLQ